jgi:hypothetical protein
MAKEKDESLVKITTDLKMWHLEELERRVEKTGVTKAMQIRMALELYFGEMDIAYLAPRKR